VCSGVKTYLALPAMGSLTEGHCLIVPCTHVNSTLLADEDVWTEMRNFKKCLIRMFAREDQGVLFMETVMEQRKNRHTVVECVPLPRALADEAPLYFKVRGYRTVFVPTQHVDLIAPRGGKRVGLATGNRKRSWNRTSRGRKTSNSSTPQARVCAGRCRRVSRSSTLSLAWTRAWRTSSKTRSSFRATLARYRSRTVTLRGTALRTSSRRSLTQYTLLSPSNQEIVGGMLDVNPALWLRPKRSSADADRRRVLEFSRRWSPFDWTKQLNEAPQTQ